jgi:hypothetical protein
VNVKQESEEEYESEEEVQISEDGTPMPRTKKKRRVV